VETIILLTIFILVPLANYVIERMRRRYQPPRPPSASIPDMGMRRQTAPARPPRLVRRDHFPEESTEIPVQRTQTHRSGRNLFKNKRDVRRVIIAITVLGPCRAYDPPS
jgi:hypothetical protein